MTFVAELEPRAVWAHFDRILTIPRASKREDKMRDHVIGLARRRGLEHETDATGNLVVRKPATAGRAGAPITVLQAHLDMVQEKNSDVAHDFARDAIQPRRDGEWLKASGTTLGADNGIGVATMLALLEADDLEHGPLELLFTVDEETGLTGATGLSATLLRGRRLINLDSEEEGVVTIGCAGGATSRLALVLGDEATPAGGAAIEVRLHGLKGGHSGIDIHLQRGNAIALLARALHAATLGTPGRLAGFAGGNAHNAIPREAHATVVAPGGALDGIRTAIEAEIGAVRNEYRTADPGMALEVRSATPPARSWDGPTSSRVLALLCGLPHGVTAMSLEIPGLVETSDNLATVAVDGGRMSVLLSTRSSVASALGALRRKIRAIATLAGATVDELDGYPGWKPDVASPLLAVLSRVYEEKTGRPPRVGAVHAGLECGILGEKYRGMDMISFGPQIEFPHSPDERVRIDSVGRFYDLLGATLARVG